MMKTKRHLISFFLFSALVLIFAMPSVSFAQASTCAVDYDGDGARTPADVAQFIVAFGAPSSAADLNGDGAVDNFDVNTFVAYYGFAPCPWKADYQYNRVIDNVDLLFFQFLLGTGSLRADLNGDGVAGPADFAIFTAAFGSTY
ncbi:MAG: GC-type dockerin domain-anchored protein [Myxococcota bacterium]